MNPTALVFIILTSIRVIAAQSLECCYYGPPSSCSVVVSNPLENGTFVKNRYVPRGAKSVVSSIRFGPGPECCCTPDSTGSCDDCVCPSLPAQRGDF